MSPQSSKPRASTAFVAAWAACQVVANYATDGNWLKAYSSCQSSKTRETLQAIRQSISGSLEQPTTSNARTPHLLDHPKGRHRGLALQRPRSEECFAPFCGKAHGEAGLLPRLAHEPANWCRIKRVLARYLDKKEQMTSSLHSVSQIPRHAFSLNQGIGSSFPKVCLTITARVLTLEKGAAFFRRFELTALLSSG